MTEQERDDLAQRVAHLSRFLVELAERYGADEALDVATVAFGVAMRTILDVVRGER